MKLISFDASPKQLSRLRNGHRVRIKRGTGFNLVVNPSNYNIVHRAFKDNRGVNISLSKEEIEHNRNFSPEQHEALTDDIDDEIFKPSMEGGNIFKKINKALHSRTAKKIGRELKPFTRALKKTGKEYLHSKLAEAHMMGADRYGDNEHAANLMNYAASLGHEKIHGMGLYAYGKGLSSHHALKLANLANATANHHMARLHNMSVHGQHTQPIMRSYHNASGEPASRGTGINPSMSMIRGRGAVVGDGHMSHPALHSQPYGANFHFQFMLPPQYKKFHNGGDVEGRGLTI